MVDHKQCFCLFVDCELVGGCVGDVLLVMCCCVGCVLALLSRGVWVCEWCISSRVCIVVVLSVCISDEPSVCCVCGYI